MIRFVGLVSLSFVLMLQVANSDEIRRAAFADGLLGKWVPATEQCEAQNKSALIVSGSKYEHGGESCSVRWIVETAGAEGANYSVHASCVDRSEPPKATITDLIIRLQNSDRISVGRSFTELKTFNRCPQ